MSELLNCLNALKIPERRYINYPDIRIERKLITETEI